MPSLWAHLDTQAPARTKEVPSLCLTLLEQTKAKIKRDVMSDLIIGTIIGGAIGVIGSMLGFIIQGYFSNKNTSMQIESRKEEQSRLFEHEKDSQVLSRIIERRARYLDPLSDQLGELHTFMNDFRDKIIKVIVSYQSEEDKIRGDRKIRIDSEEKQEFIEQFEVFGSAVEEIDNRRQKIFEASYKVTDVNLQEMLWDLVKKLYAVVHAYYDMGIVLEESETGDNPICDFEAIFKPVRDANVCIPRANHRIESLLAGADADD